MNTLPCLNKGGKARIVAPAGKIAREHVMPAVDWLNSQGFRVEMGQHVFARHFQFAGTDRQRLEDLQSALDDPDTDVIICSRGGYGTIRIIDQLDFSKFMQYPKWVIGFSDITILHNRLNLLGIPSVHGAMPRYFFDENGNPSESLNTIFDFLLGKKPDYKLPPGSFNRNGNATAGLVGGNLSIICSLLGTKYELETDGKILFIEDIDEYLYHTDRMMHQLKLAGKLQRLAGLVVGSFSGMKDNSTPFGKTAYEIIRDAVDDYNFPVYFGFPAGHTKRNLALVLGMEWELDVNSAEPTLKML